MWFRKFKSSFLKGHATCIIYHQIPNVTSRCCNDLIFFVLDEAKTVAVSKESKFLKC